MSEINNINRRKFLEIFGTCSCGLLLPACSTAPITDRKQLKLIPETTLNRQAAQIFANVKRKTKLSDDTKQLDEIKEIGSKIENAVSLYFDSINKKDPTYNFNWEYIFDKHHYIQNLRSTMSFRIAPAFWQTNLNQRTTKTFYPRSFYRYLSCFDLYSEKQTNHYQ